jgi:parallel beta-helix repeat protein
MKKLLLPTVILLGVLWSFNAFSTTRYLAGGSADQTATFQNLVNQSVAGDIIIVQSGNHYLSGTVIINKNGIIVRGDAGNVIRKTGNVSSVDITASNVTVDNLYIDGGNRPEPCARLYGNYNTIVNCTFRNSGNSGLLIHGCHHNTIQACKAYYNYMVGISQWAHTDGTVRDCQMYENGAEGLTIDGGTHNNRVFNNWIHLNNVPIRGVGGIGVDASNGAWVYNNTIDYNGRSGITLQNNLCCGIDGMRIYNNQNISYNQQCAVMLRTTQPITNFQFTNNTCVGNPGGVQCSTSSLAAAAVASLEADDAAQAQVYPNPVHNELTISGTNDITELTILHNSGGTFLTKKNSGLSPLKVDVSGLEKGWFFIKLTNTKGKTETRVLFKE